MSQPNPSAPAAGQNALALIYVVDDEPLLLDSASFALRSAGYRFETFSDPRQALAAFAAAPKKPDLLITDFAMSPMDGIQLIEKCKGLHPGLKTILQSGTLSEDIMQSTSIAVDRFLAKPYRIEEFLRLVRSVLAG